MSRAISGEDPLPVAAAQTALPIGRSEPVDTEHVDDSVLQISGAGHWFLEGWIGDLVECLVDSGSSVTAIPDTGPRWGTGESIEVYFTNIAWC